MTLGTPDGGLVMEAGKEVRMVVSPIMGLEQPYNEAGDLSFIKSEWW